MVWGRCFYEGALKYNRFWFLRSCLALCRINRTARQDINSTRVFTYIWCTKTNPPVNNSFKIDFTFLFSGICKEVWGLGSGWREKGKKGIGAIFACMIVFRYHFSSGDWFLQLHRGICRIYFTLVESKIDSYSFLSSMKIWFYREILLLLPLFLGFKSYYFKSRWTANALWWSWSHRIVSIIYHNSMRYTI